MRFVFGNPSVSYLPVSKQSFDNKEDVFYFTANKGFLVFQMSVPVKAGSLALPMVAVFGVGAVVNGGKSSSA